MSLADLTTHSISRDLDLMAILATSNHVAEHCAAEWSAVRAGREFSNWPRGWQPLAPRPGADPDED